MRVSLAADCRIESRAVAIGGGRPDSHIMTNQKKSAKASDVDALGPVSVRFATGYFSLTTQSDKNPIRFSFRRKIKGGAAERLLSDSSKLHDRRLPMQLDLRFCDIIMVKMRDQAKRGFTFVPCGLNGYTPGANLSW